MALVNEKPRKRQFILDVDEDELKALVEWGVNVDPAKYQTDELDNRLHRTLRRALSGSTRSSEGDSRVAPAKRSQTLSDVSGGIPDRQQGRTIDVGEGQTWVARD